MNETERAGDDLDAEKPPVKLFDPFEEHFVSQNGRNEFQKALEEHISGDFDF